MNASSTCAFSVPVKRHCAMNRFFECAVISFIDQQRQRHGEDRDQRQQRRDRDHHDDDADDGERRRQHHAQRLLQALRDVVDVVGDPAQEIAAWCAVDVSERQAVQLVFDVAPQLVHRALHDTGEDEALRVREQRGGDVDQQRLEQHPMQLAEVDAARTLDAGHDDVGRVAEDPGTDDGEGDADHREQQHRGDAEPFGRHAVQQAPNHVAEVLRPLDRHPDAEAGTGVHRDALTCVRDLFVCFLRPFPFGDAPCTVRGITPPPRRRTVIRRSPGRWDTTRAARGGCRGRRCGPPRARESGRRARSSTPVGRRRR